MSQIYTFTNEKFSITEDVYFTVDTTVIKGNRICKLKTLKIFYHGDSFEMITKTDLYNFIITDGLRSIPSVELINYLNNLSNGTNLFDVYKDLSKKALDQSFRRSPERINEEDFASLIIHDKSNEYDPNRYKYGLIDNSRFIKSELNKTRNPNYPICYSKFEDIDVIPIYCYIHPSLAINQGSTIILCHLGYILEKLANYHRFPEFNTQAMISFLNATNKSKLYSETVEETNNFELINEIKRLRNELENKNKENEDLKTLNAKILSYVKQQNNKIDNLESTINNQTTEIGGLKSTINNQSNKIDNLESTNQGLTTEISGLRKDVGKIVSNVSRMVSTTYSCYKDINNQIEEKIPENSISTKSTLEVFILINRKSLNEEITSKFDKLEKAYLILDSISCQSRDREQQLKAHNYNENEDEIVFEHTNRNALDINKFVQNHGDIIIPLSEKIKTPDYKRKFIVKVEDLPKLISELELLVQASNSPREELLKSNEKIIKSSIDPIDEILAVVKGIKIEHENSEKQIQNTLSQMKEDISSLKEDVKKQFVTKEDLIEILGSLPTCIYSNKHYRKLIYKSDGYVYFVPIVGEQEEKLTFKTLLISILRNDDGTYKPNENRNKLINEKYLN